MAQYCETPKSYVVSLGMLDDCVVYACVKWIVLILYLGDGGEVCIIYLYPYVPSHMSVVSRDKSIVKVELQVTHSI